jgi:hypothetical protein
MLAQATDCSRCGNKLEYPEDPDLDRDDNEPICSECYHDQYEFTCCCCCEYGDVADQHNMLIVFEELYSHGATRTVGPGIYRILGGPYYGGPLIGSGWLYGDRLERVADVNPDMDGEGYPCGHLCLGCQEKVLAQFAAKCSVCKTDSASCLRVKLGSWKDFKASVYQWTRPKVLCAACRHKHRGAWEIAKRMGT